MNVNKSLLAVLSMFLILLLFVSSASAADTNATDVLSVDKSANLENNNTLALDAASNDNNAVENDEILQNPNSNDDILGSEYGPMIIDKIEQNPNPGAPGEPIGIVLYINPDCISTAERLGDEKITLTWADESGEHIRTFTPNHSGVMDFKSVRLSESTLANFYKPETAAFDEFSVDFTINVTSPTPVTDTWYVNSSATGGDGKTPETAFKTLNDALNVAQDGNTILITSGEYKGNNNTNLTINKNLNFIKYGDGEAIFDAQGLSKIWTVNASSINITGLTFKNGKAKGSSDFYNRGGALDFEYRISNSNINATFINNTATSQGGAIFFYDDVFNVNISGLYVNNNADESGVIFFNKAVNNLILSGNYENNTGKYGIIWINGELNNCQISGNYNNNMAIMTGAALFYLNKLNNVSISGNYINNDGDLLFSISDLDLNSIVKDAIFINNNNLIYAGGNNITVINSWFGNNATNYNKTPDAGAVNMDNWLFLNATANPTELNVSETSTIAFKLSSYNSTSGEISKYDASKMNAIMELSQTLGALNQTTALIGEDVIYTAKQEGNASVTGKIGTAFYTVNLKNNASAPRKDLNISASAEPIIAGENATIIVTGFENATGDVTARIDGGTLSTTIVNGTATFNVPGLTSSTTAYISYRGNDEYNAASTTVNITVIPKSDVVIVAENVTKYYHGPERFVANIYDSELNPMVNKSVNITINGVTYTKITDSNGSVSIGINLGSGTYDVITTVDNATVKSSVTVLSTITGNDIIKYYRNETQYSVQVFDTTGKAVGAGKVVTFNVNGRFYNRTTDANGIATLNINLPQGEYVITAINPVTGEMQANNITVLPVVAAEDITMKYLDGTQFVATLVDGQGNPYKDQFVTFNVNGILYNRLTDSNGQAALNIRLPPGEYIITSSFNGCNIANKITVMGVL